MSICLMTRVNGLEVIIKFIFVAFVNVIFCILNVWGGPKKSIVSFRRVITSVVLRILQKNYIIGKKKVIGFPVI